MLLYHLYLIQYLCVGMILITLLILAFMGYAYSINEERADDDPEKKQYHWLAIVVGLFTWPFLLFGIISLFLLRALLYGIFLILFILSLVIFPRQRSEPTGLERIAARIGDALLKANMTLIRLLLWPWAREPDMI